MKNTPEYRPPSWLRGGHAQTIWPLLRKGTLPGYRRQRWATPDGDFIDLDWVDAVPGQPLVVLFHGLEGSSRSHYARSLMGMIAGRGWAGVVVHFRGCSGEPNRLARAYHSGDSEEIGWIVRRLHVEYAGPLFAVGVSLGGNALLKWLGEQGDAASIIGAAAAVSAPLDLAASNAALSNGFNRLYARHFLRTLIPAALGKHARHPGLIDAERARAARTLKDFDDAVTAPLHGFRDAADYYARSSAKHFLAGIRIPTLLLNARNDPFLPALALPDPRHLPASIIAEFPAEGGHVGFVDGRFPGHNDWLAQRLLGYFSRQMESLAMR
jgi:predicted alpha/beta-fold hydrolase